ncbi:MAG: arginine repressor [Actinobacteria bacterium]|nr:arginine repressor [Actinomycetota bacterium]
MARAAGTVSKPDRQRLIVGLLHDHEVQSQEQLCDLLADHGVHTTQATVSRDLDELGAVKVRGASGALAYRLASDPAPATARDRLSDVVQRFVVEVHSSGNLAVLRTPPAGAGPVAAAVDLAELPGVLATVAGDDTVVVIAREGIAGRDLARRFRDLADLT